MEKIKEAKDKIAVQLKGCQQILINKEQELKEKIVNHNV